MGFLQSFKKKNISIIIAPHYHSRTYSVTFPRLFWYFILFLLFIGLILLVSFLLTYGRLAKRAIEYDELVKKNQALIEETQKMRMLEKQLIELQQFEQKIRDMLGHHLQLDKESSTDTLSHPLQTSSVNNKTIAKTSADVGVTQSQKENNLSEIQNKLLRSILSVLPIDGWITAYFGDRTGYSVINPHQSGHQELNIVAAVGTPVQATADGKVIFAGWKDRLGNTVIIEHGYGFSTLYAHNSRIVVRVNEQVESGRTIAYLGNTGRSIAPHLHYEVRLNGKPVEPLKYLIRRERGK